MLFSQYYRTVSATKKIFFRLYSIPQKKKVATLSALEHFDQFYAPIFDNWPSMRLGLLCPHYYCAFVNVFSKKISASETFQDMEVFNMKDMYHLNLAKIPGLNKHEDDAEPVDDVKPTEPVDLVDSKGETSLDAESEDDKEYMPANRIKNRDLDNYEEDYTDMHDSNINYKAQLVPHGTIHFPEHWDIYYCPRGKFKRFPSPKPDASGLLNYYLMDGASILPVLALDIKKGEDVGDLCAAPGGKSLAVLFGMQFGKLVVNDVSLLRVNKLKTVLDLYIPGTQEWSKKILVSNLDVAEWNFLQTFDKILLDVPCTNDRMSVSKDNNNIFKSSRFHERMLLPKLQTNMLRSALKALKPGGSLVYSTCTLSPIQNDGVVHMALAKLSTQCDSEFVVNDLKEAFYPLRNMFQFSDVCSYGQLVVPFLPLNYGPMYIAKITRNK